MFQTILYWLRWVLPNLYNLAYDVNAIHFGMSGAANPTSATNPVTLHRIDG